MRLTLLFVTVPAIQDDSYQNTVLNQIRGKKLSLHLNLMRLQCCGYGQFSVRSWRSGLLWLSQREGCKTGHHYEHMGASNGYMMRARSNACGTAANGKIFIAGGMGPNKRECNLTSEVYNVTTNEWQLIASLMAPRVGGSMVCLKGALYVVGGVCQSSSSTDDSFSLTVESSDFENKEWKQKTKIPIAEDLPRARRSKRYVLVCALTVCEEFHGKPTTSKRWLASVFQSAFKT